MTNKWTEEELLVDDIRNALVDADFHDSPDGSPNFLGMSVAVVDTIRAAIYDRVGELIEYGFDQTIDIQGPDFEFMAQLIYDKFFKESND